MGVGTRGALEPCQPKIANFSHPIIVQQDVVVLKVTVNNALQDEASVGRIRHTLQ